MQSLIHEPTLIYVSLSVHIPQILGDLSVTGSSNLSLDTSDSFLINSATTPTQSLFKIDSEGIAVFRAQDASAAAPTPVVGGLYYTDTSVFVGID